MVAVLAALAMWLPRNRLPELSTEEFETEMTAWFDMEPADYEIVTHVTGRQPATYEVHVRDGEVVLATRNGAPLTQLRTMGTWSVPGMFGTMERDVANLMAHQDGTAGPRTPRVLLRAEFDPQWHYPAQYQRVEWGNPYEVTWQVTRFDVGSSK